MKTSFEQFTQSLSYPPMRDVIGLRITDEDAASLLGNEGWAKTYYDQWSASLPPVFVPAPAYQLPSWSNPEQQYQAQAQPVQAPLKAKPQHSKTVLRLRNIALVVIGAFVLIVFVSCSVAIATGGSSSKIESFTAKERAYLDVVLVSATTMTVDQLVESGRDETEVVDMAREVIDAADAVCVLDVLNPENQAQLVATYTEIGWTEEQSQAGLAATLAYCAA